MENHQKIQGSPAEVQDMQHMLSTLGLCARARRLVIGTPLVCEALRAGSPDAGQRASTPQGKRRGQVVCVLEAADTSDNTHDKLISKCAFYRVPLYRLAADTLTLGRAVGKEGPVASVGVTDPNLFGALKKYLPADG